jgi:hypothetical protein
MYAVRRQSLKTEAWTVTLGRAEPYGFGTKPLAVLRVLTSQRYFLGALTVCYGFVTGWFAGWMAKRRQASR